MKKNWKIFMPIVTGAILLAGYSTGFFFFSGITPCLPPPGLAVDGIAAARVYTWLDENGNGKIETSEPVFPNVEIIHPLSDPQPSTDSTGQAATQMFRPGCACDCWKNQYVEIAIPDGFRPTTSVRKELTGDNLLYEFGFIRVNPE